MRVLFDVNLLIALFDLQHTQNKRAQDWWSTNSAHGWASCPLTQNGFVRIVSNPNYQNPITTTFAMDFFGQQIRDSDHACWSDDISLLDTDLVDRDRILGPGQLTGVYLLALAVKNGGRLATMDTTIPLAAVHAGRPEHLVVI